MTNNSEARMADITIGIPTAEIVRVIDALCAAGGYAGDPSNKAACREFARSVVADFIRQTVVQAERQQAMSAAMAAITVDPITID